MGFVDLHRRAQCVTGSLEAGFEDVVSIFARKLYKVDGGGHAAGKAQPEFLGALHVKIAHLLGGAVDVPVQGAAAGQVHRAQDQRFVHGQVETAVALDAAHIAQRPGKRLPQRDAHILGGVVVIHLHVPVAGEHQIEPAVPGKQLQHVVQEAAPRVDLVTAGAVQIQRKVDLGLVGVAFQRDHPVFHGSFLQNFVQCFHKGLHLLRRADGDAQPVGDAGCVKMPHQNAVFF